MTRIGGVPQTRISLLRAVRRLERVRKAAELLRRKREALVTEFFRHARPVAEARAVIAGQSHAAYDALVPAFSVHGEAGLRAMTWPVRDPRVDIRPDKVGGIPTSEIVAALPTRRTLGARGTAPDLTGTSAATAASEFEEMAQLLLESAPREIMIRRLAEELARTSRQVNILEKRTAPSLEGEIGFIQRTLDEREREEHVRLRLLQTKKARARLIDR